MLPPICILAGGLGTRLGETAKLTPKPLIEIAGAPFLVHQIQLLARYGANEIVLCVGHLGDEIEHRIGHLQDGIRIVYSYDLAGLEGTLGAIRRAQSLLGNRFLVLYGDTYLQIDYEQFANSWNSSGRLAAMSVLKNANTWDRSNVIFENGEIVDYDKFTPTPKMQWIDYGLGALDASALGLVGPEVSDLAYLYHELARRGEIFGYEATTRFYEIGTPESLVETDRFLRSKNDL